MSHSIRSIVFAIVAAISFGQFASAIDSTVYLKPGEVQLKSAGPLSFTEDGVLLVGDPKAAAVYAIAVSNDVDVISAERSISDLIGHISKSTGGGTSKPIIKDMAVSPKTGEIFLSVSKGDQALLISINGTGKVKPFSLEKVKFAKANLPNPPEDKITGEGRRRGNRRLESITDVAYTDGKVIVTGLSNADSASTVHSFPFPFTELESGTPIEIYHGAHGRYEDYAAVRSFVPFNIGGEPHLLAGFTCTPLVKFPLKELAAGNKYRGTTVAELGNRNRPLDMIVYQKDDKDYILMTNTARGVMKISTEDIENNKGITERVAGGGIAGQSYETIADLINVTQMDKLGDKHAVIITEAENGRSQLSTIKLP